MNTSNGHLPRGWTKCIVNDVTLPVETADPKGTPESEFLYLDISAIDNETQQLTTPKRYRGKEAPSRARQVVAENDTLFSTVRTYLKNIAMVPAAFHGQIASTGFAVLRPNAAIHPKFLFHYTLTTSFLNPLGELQRGSSYPAVRENDVRSQQLALPPLNEQRRIVAKIEELFSELDKGIENLKQARAQLAVYRQSLLKHAFEGHLTAAWRAQNADKLESADQLVARVRNERRHRWEQAQLKKLQHAGMERLKNRKDKFVPPKEPVTVDLPQLPAKWCCASFDQIFVVERGRFSFRPRNDPRFYGGDMPFVQIGDLPSEGGLIREYRQTLNTEGISVSKKFSAGTVLIAIVGATIGNTGILNFESCCPDSLVALQSSSQPLLRYAEAFLRNKKYGLRVAASASGGQPNINLNLLQPMPMPLPPLREVEVIVEKLEAQMSQVSSLESDIDLNLQKAEALRHLILKKAFAGELVPQDPNDEPASELLARIRAERAAGVAAGKKAGRGLRLKKVESFSRAPAAPKNRAV